MKIIIINGVPTSGKSTFSDFAKESDYKVYSFSTVSYVKEVAKTIGWDGIKDAKGRRFLSDLKDALTRYNDAPFQKIKESIEFTINKHHGSTDKLIFFLHCREPEEIQRWVDECDAKTLLIRRAAAEEREHDNHADSKVFEYDYDYVYSNEGDLDKLREEAIQFTNWIGQKTWESKI